MSSYLIELETINIFNTSINKIILFKSAESAYEYALKIEPLIKRETINMMEKAIEMKIIWESNNNIFPKYKCKITPIDNDILWGLYHLDKDTGRYLIQNIYTNLKVNNII